MPPLGATVQTATSAIAALRNLVRGAGEQFASIAWNDSSDAIARTVAAEVGEANTDLDIAARRVAGADLEGAARLYGDARDHVDQLVSIVRHAGAVCGSSTQPPRAGMIEAIDVVEVGGYAAQVTAHGDDVWVAIQDGRTVVRVDARNGRVLARVPVDDDDLRTIQVANDGVWVRGATALHRIDATTNRVAQTIPKRAIGNAVTRAFVDDAEIWACNGNTVVRASKQDGHPLATIALSYPCGTVSAALGQVWSTSDTGVGDASRIDPHRNAVAFTVAIDAVAATFPSIAGNIVWTNSQDAGVASPAAVGLDAATGRTIATTRLASGGGPGALDESTYYVADTDRGVVDAIDAHTGRVLRTYDGGAEPNAVALEGSTLWVIDEATGRLLRFAVGHA